MRAALDALLCPITLSLPVDPVLAEDGNLYDQASIETHLRHTRRSPLTNLPMGPRLVRLRHVTDVLEGLLQADWTDERLLEWKEQRRKKDLLKLCVSPVALFQATKPHVDREKWRELDDLLRRYVGNEVGKSEMQRELKAIAGPRAIRSALHCVVPHICEIKAAYDMECATKRLRA